MRDPRDVIVSCYFQYLPPNPTSVSYLTWESTARRYAVDMGTWLRLRERLDASSWLEVRYEDVVVVTETGVENFTEFLPRELKDIEKLVGKNGVVQKLPAVSEGELKRLR